MVNQLESAFDISAEADKAVSWKGGGHHSDGSRMSNRA